MRRAPRHLFAAAAVVVAIASASAALPSQGAGASATPADYADVIDRTGAPAAAENGFASKLSPLADQGSHHGYGLPAKGDVDAYGGFTGPWYMAQEYPWFMSRSFSRVQLKDSDTGKVLDLPAPTTHSYPGRITQTYTVDGVTLELELRFTAQHTALVTADISATTDRRLEVSWSGELMRPKEEPQRSALGLKRSGTGVEVHFARTKGGKFYADGTERLSVRHPEPVDTTIDGNAYVTTRRDPLTISSKPSRLVWTESYTFNDQEREAEAGAVETALTSPDAAARTADKRWQRYINRATKDVSPENRRLAVKAVETLVGNWRGPGGRLSHGGIVPSMSHTYYAGGYWPWDSFKEAVGTSVFSPELAKSVVRNQFEHQVTSGNEAGMLPDVVGFRSPADGTGHSNMRNTKPPLAGWAVWEIFRSDRDRDFLAEIYPKLVAEHAWWLRNRDHDRNGVLEYGATTDPANNSDDAARIAAAWESGMDDLPRFDFGSGLEVRHNKDQDGNLIGYSLNQESVDLNSFMARNNRALAKIAAELGKDDASKSFEAQADHLDEKIRTTMWDEESGYFYDTRMGTGKPMTSVGKGIEGMVPLFSGSATDEQAAQVRDALLDPEQFNTFVPLPPLPKNHPEYDPDSYTRGSAWPDQVSFAFTGLDAYGLGGDAEKLRAKLFSNADGLLNGDEPIWEKYDSATGKGNNTGNFSWSAAGILHMLQKPAHD
ncbi:trehalase family glycosidase [Streptomyces parvus]|uniref:MGH1-like glycoside hydrolase domain-containing protein n=1 Tax=Streptomyces parvus TaxID=66428 RepID=UPI003430635C